MEEDDTLELLANLSKKKKSTDKKPNEVKTINEKKTTNETTDENKTTDENLIVEINKNVENYDDNKEILELLKERMEMGIDKYGHGVKVNQNTQDFGTKDDDWELMALEEMLDGLIYTTAQIIRYRRKKNLSEEKKNVNL